MVGELCPAVLTAKIGCVVTTRMLRAAQLSLHVPHVHLLNCVCFLVQTVCCSPSLECAAQGVVTVPDPTHPLGASHLFYVGNLGYDVVHYIALDSSDPANDLHVSTVGYLTPFTDLFNFTLSAPTNNSPEPNPKLSASATAANNGDSVCLLSLANDPLLFTPMYGGNGGWPTRSQAAYDYFLARARAAGSAAANRPVPAPHVLCDAGDEGGMSQYLTKLVAEGLVGRPWFT